VDIAHSLGCDDIRCNLRGGPPDWKQDRDLVARAVESFGNLLEYARGSGLNILIENHGGASSDPDVLVRVVEEVGDPRFGTLPDFGNINDGDDRYEAIRKILPYAKGVSVKAAWSADGSHPRWDVPKLIRICQDDGFHGCWGIESNFALDAAENGSPAADRLWADEVKGVRLTKDLLDRIIFKKPD
jgi:sugar phosphate isomerase/epimerase